LNSGVEQRSTKGKDSGRLIRRRAWVYVGLMMLCILLTLPTTPILWKWAIETFGDGINSVAYVVFFFCFFGFSILTIRRRSETRFKDFLILCVFMLVYLYLLKYQCRFPAERLHLAEYGALAYLLYSALRMDFLEGKAYFLGFIAASGFGLFDELIQFILPNRVFEMRDVATNIIAAGLGLLVIKFLVRPNPVRSRSIEA
jgi:hypothetical protein